jgi:hypothetical protein
MKLALLIISFLMIPTNKAWAGLVDSSPLGNGSMLRAPEVSIKGSTCAQKIEPGTRQLLFNFFHSTAHRDQRSATANIDRYAKMIGKIFAESSGNPVGYSDMNSRGSSQAVRAFYANGGKASIAMYEQLRANTSVTRNHKTNIGLLQISVDQLYWRPNVRKLFNDTIAKFNRDPKAGLQMCGTRNVFTDSERALLAEFNKFKDCTVGNKKEIVGKNTVPVVSDDELTCFDRWASFCPNLNIGMGLLLPAAYFETSGAAPLCRSELGLILAVHPLQGQKLIENQKQPCP